MASDLDEDLRSLVKKKLSENGIEAYKLEMEKNSEIGGFIGEIIFFTISIENDPKVQSYVMKASRRSENVPVDRAYDREIFTYTKIFPAFRRFIDIENPEFVFDFVPKIKWIFSGPPREMLVFENLKTDGFRLFDYREPWNLEHSLCVMEHYGKYHGISLALSDRRPGIFKKLTENLTPVTDEFVFEDVEKLFIGNMEIVFDILRGKNRLDLIEKFRKIRHDVIQTTRTEDCDKLVICHGDSWNNNVMFNYKDGDESKPSNVRFLDFQFSVVCTPVKDLSFNIYSTCDSTCLDHFDDLLRTYYESLSRTLRSFGSDPDQLFTYEQLIEHWKKYAIIGLLGSLQMMKTLLAKYNETCGDAQSIKSKIENEERFNKRILDMFVQYGERFL